MELKSQESMPLPDPLIFNFLGSSRLPYNPTENPETPRVYYSGEKLKFRLNVPFQNIVTENLSLKLRIGNAYKSVPFSNSIATDEYIEFEFIVSGVDVGNMYVEEIENLNKLLVYKQSAWGWAGPIFMSGCLGFYFTGCRNILFPISSADYNDAPDVILNGSDSVGSSYASTILLKRSNEPNKIPQPSDLVSGELAVNTADGRLFLKKTDNSIISITPIEPQVFSTNNLNLSSSVNNLDLGSKSVIRISTSGQYFNVSGFLPGYDGEIKMVYSSGPDSFFILNNSELSQPNNRVIISSEEDYEVRPNYGFSILYDGISGAWRLFN